MNNTYSRRHVFRRRRTPSVINRIRKRDKKTGKPSSCRRKREKQMELGIYKTVSENQNPRERVSFHNTRAVLCCVVLCLNTCTVYTYTA